MASVLQDTLNISVAPVGGAEDPPTKRTKLSEEVPNPAEPQSAGQGQDPGDGEEEQEDPLPVRELNAKESWSDWDEGEFGFRSLCRRNVMAALQKELGMPEAAARKYALDGFDISCSEATYEEVDELRSVTCKAEFQPPAEAPAKAKAVTIDLDYHFRARWSSAEFFLNCEVNGSKAFANRMNAKNRECPKFSLKKTAVKTALSDFGAWKSAGTEEIDFKKQLFRVFFAGVGISWARGAGSHYVCVHGDGNQWFEKAFQKL